MKTRNTEKLRKRRKNKEKEEKTKILMIKYLRESGKTHPKKTEENLKKKLP